MVSEHDTRPRAVWEHILWCAEQAIEVWKVYRPDDKRPQAVVDYCRRHCTEPMQVHNLREMFEAVDDVQQALASLPRVDGFSAHARLAAEYAATAVLTMTGNGPIGVIMRDVRVFTAHARAHHAAERSSIAHQAPTEILRVETDTLELVTSEQDNDLRRRLIERVNL